MFAIVYGIMLWSYLVRKLSLLLLALRGGEVAELSLGVPVQFLNLECYCASGGGYLGGGSFGSSVPRSPGVTLQRSGAAHGPVHPRGVLLKTVILCVC